MEPHYGWLVVQRAECAAVTRPDGTVTLHPPEEGEQEAAEHNQEHPDSTARATWRTARTWMSDLSLPDAREKTYLPPVDRPHAFPTEEVAATLNELARKRWTVLHVSEDRGLYSGDHVENEALIIRARYLLVQGA